MASQRRAVIIGGSMSGLLAGITLSRRGWAVDIFERVEKELAGRGAGIVAQAELIGRLNALGLDTRDLGVAMSTRKILDAAGRTTATLECPQVLTAWERVYRVLRDAFPAAHYHRGCGLKGFAQNGLEVLAHFSDGSSIAAEVLIGADGLRSTVRQQCLPDTVPLYAGYVAWRALLPENAIPPEIHRELFMLMTFCLPPGEQCLGYPVTGPDNELRAGQRRYNVVWYRPADEATELPGLLTDKNGVVHSVSIPPPLIRAEPIAAMRAAAERLLAPQFRAIVALIDEPILQPIYDIESPRLAFGRVAIIGDAAFVARPHVAAGVSKAADDATALAAALDGDDVEVALRRFEAERLPDNRKIIERARHLGAYLQATQTAEERARSARHSIPEAVLAETAVLDFLY
ncbi:MAG: FAD binding domain-containing protein [Xanthobacteraceae bacterium]|jgi:2-polyprenyl-6-methoxyphenol hydroxylase-like FAD-dependent oxidoreductase